MAAIIPYTSILNLDGRVGFKCLFNVCKRLIAKVFKCKLNECKRKDAEMIFKNQLFMKILSLAPIWELRG